MPRVTFPRLVPKNVVHVAKAGAEFTSIKAAYDSITDASATNPYHISVGPGIYTEAALTAKAYVSISGPAIGTAVVKPAGSHHIFEDAEAPAEINFLTLQDAPATFAGLSASDFGDYLLLHKVSFVDCAAGVKLRAPTVAGVAYLEYVDFSGNVVLPIDIAAAGTEADLSLSIENTFTIPYGGSATTAVSVVGPKAVLSGQACIFTGLGYTGTGLLVDDGGAAHVVSTKFEGFSVGINLAATGQAPIGVFASVNTEDNTTCIVLSHASTQGSFGGVADRSKMSINASADYPFVYNDPGAGAGAVVVGDLFLGDSHAALSAVKPVLPTTGEKAALAGTSGAPGDANRYVTNADSRNTDARTPTAHQASHVTGADQIPTFSATARGLVPSSVTADQTKFLRDDGVFVVPPGGGGGDSVSVNGVAAVDVDLDDTTPAAPGDGVNVRWQKDTGVPNNVSANVPFAGIAQAGVVSTAAQTFSGTKRFEDQVTLDDGLRLEEQADPASPPADTAEIYAADNNGNTVIRYIAPDGSIMDLGPIFVAQNTEGASITKGQVVYISGGVGASGVPQVKLARADSITTLPGSGLVLETSIANNAFGRIQRSDLLRGVSTTGFTEGDRVFVSATTAGAFTATEPAHPNLKQRIGIVLNIHASNGTIFVDPAAVRGDHEGTNQDSWKVGSNTAGAKDLIFRNGNDLILRANPTGARTVTIPDTTGTVALVGEAPAAHQASHVTGGDQIPTFTSSARGLVPASGGGTTNFLRADGSFAAPPSGGADPEPATFFAVFDRIVPAANKYMATLFNTSATRKVVVQRLYHYNWQVTAVTGVSLEQYVARITARTVGTAVTIRNMDDNDTLSSGISADTNSTAVTESHIFRRGFFTNEEGSGILTAAIEDFFANDGRYQLVWEKHQGIKGITLRQNQGITFRNVTSSTVGSCSYVIVFSDEAA